MLYCIRRYHPRRKTVGHGLQRGVLLLEKVLYAVWVRHVSRNLVLVAKNEIIRVIQNLSRLAFFEGDLALHGDQHGGRPPRRRIKQQRHRFQGQHLAPQHRITVRRIGYHSKRSLRKEFMHRCSRQPLFDAVTRRLVFQRRYRNDVNALRQRVAPPPHAIPAAGTPRRNTYERNSNPPPHGTNFSASFTAFKAGSGLLSAAPQSQKELPSEGSLSG